MDAQALIQIYRTGFFICAGIAALGLALSILFFFRFRIRDIWAVRTGRAQKKAVHDMQEASRNEGRMRKDERKYGKICEDSPPETTEDLRTEEITETLFPEPETELLQTELLESDPEVFRITQQVVLIHTDEKIP